MEKKKKNNSARRFSKEPISRRRGLETSVHFANLTIITGLRRFRESRATDSRGKSYERKRAQSVHRFTVRGNKKSERARANSGNPASPRRLLPASVTIRACGRVAEIYRMYRLKMDPGTGRPVSASAFNAI